MRAPISIVIPTLNAAGELGPTLGALGEGLAEGLIRELIVSDGGSDDETLPLARQAGARIVSGAPGRGAQMARGAAAAEGAWLLLLHADTHLAAGWSRAAATHMRHHPEKAGWFALRFRARGAAPALVARWANLRARLFALPYGDQGLLIPRRLLRESGGYPAIPLMEDVALARRLGRRNMRPLGALAFTGAARYERNGWLRQGGANLWRLARYLGGADPERLARHYR